MDFCSSLAPTGFQDLLCVCHSVFSPRLNFFYISTQIWNLLLLALLSKQSYLLQLFETPSAVYNLNYF